MKINIVKNKYLNALFLLMLVSAAVHIIILVIKSFAEKSIYPLNFFHILNLNYFFPNVFKDSAAMNIASVIFLASFYLLLLALSDKNEK